MVFRSYQAENRFIFALQLGQFIWTECCVCNSLISHKTRPNSSFATNLQQASGEDFWNLMDESEISSCKPRTGGLSAWIGYTDLDQDTHFQWSDNTQDTDCVNLSNFCKEFFRHQDSLRIQLLRDCGRIHSCIADEMILFVLQRIVRMIFPTLQKTALGAAWFALLDLNIGEDLDFPILQSIWRPQHLITISSVRYQYKDS